MEVCDDRIVNGAAELFRTYGIKAVTMDTIAQHLGISKRTIYETFRDKDELLYAVMHCMMVKQKEKIQEIINSSPNVIAAIFRMIRVMRDHTASMNPLIQSDLRKYHAAVMVKMREKCEYPDYEAAIDVIIKGKQQGVFREEVDNVIVTRCFSGLGTLVNDHTLFPVESFTQRDLVKNVFINYMRGISTQKGLKIIEELEPEL